MKRINTAIIGFGLSGEYFHAPFLKCHEGYNVKKVLSSRHEEIKSCFPDSEIVTSVNDIISDDTIDLVINCGPNSLHYEYSKQTLLSGKHVVVEKPFVTKTEHGKELINIAKDMGLTLTVFHNRRWDGDFKTIKKMINDGVLGELKEFESRFDRFRPIKRENKWKENKGEGSGVLFDLGSHLIDQALTLFGEPSMIISDIGDQKNVDGADDYFHLILIYHKLRVILHSTSFGDASPRFRLQGTKKSYIKYGLDPQEDSLKSDMSPNEASFGVEDSSLHGELIDFGLNTKEVIATERGSYSDFYRKLFLAITEGEGSPVDAEDALKVIDIINKVKKEKRQIIKF